MVVFHANECRSSSRYTSAFLFIRHAGEQPGTVLEQIASDLENTDTGYEGGFGLNSVAFKRFLVLVFSCVPSVLDLFCSWTLINNPLIPENICLADSHQYPDILPTLLFRLQPKWARLCWYRADLRPFRNKAFDLFRRNCGRRRKQWGWVEIRNMLHRHRGRR